MIKYIDLALQWKKEKKELLPKIDEAISSSIYVNSSYVEKFEKSICNLLNVKYCVALNSGTDALVCGLIALGIRKNDEVITPPNSFIASTSSIAHIGAIPVFADVKSDQTIDPDEIEKKITSKTKAIMPVHLTGRMSEMDKIIKISKKHNIPIIEDSAQSILSKHKGQFSGTSGDIGCFSAHPLKNLNAIGDSGYITTNNKNIAKKISLMRNHNLIDRNKVNNFGYVSRMDTIQACVLNHRIGYITEIIKKRVDNANIYRKYLNPDYIKFNKFDKNYYDTFHTFVIQAKKRNSLQKYLLQKGIESFVHYPVPIHLQKACNRYNYKLGDFPITEMQSKMILSLPIHQYLKKKDIIKISNLINNFYK
ncbi:DegT/DnrJ/EryC1/StrS family aminotransferase [Alphaproteobacteria bacterium]|nr:DegT/DnrJ/EryC1/StrS family aminotransferase [Alphaproteobacteria bacterium]